MTALALTDNGVSGALAIGFLFRYFGQDYESVTWERTACSALRPPGLGHGNTDLPLASAPNAVLCPYWDNLNPALGVWFGSWGWRRRGGSWLRGSGCR